MADNANHPLNIEHVRDLLSPYLDDEVTAEERALVEQGLATSSKLRQELETLRQTVTLVANLPDVPAPRPFTLSEADVKPTSPAPRKFFGLPAWAGGLAMVAATLACVLAAGGIFFSLRSGSPTPEIAFVEEAAAPAEEPVDTASSAAQEEAVAMEPAAEQETAEEVAVEDGAEPEVAPEEKAAEVGQAVEAEKQVEITTEAEEGLAGEAADDMAPAEAVTESMTPTPLPLATPAPAPTPTTTTAPEVVEEEAVAEAGAAAEQPAADEVAPAPPTSFEEPEEQDLGQSGFRDDQATLDAQQEQNQTTREIAPRMVEIEDQNLQVIPGLIQIEGKIEIVPGSTLLATLQRNNEPFDVWAEPASLQTVVQSNGQFSFAIRANAERADNDLFATEPANYQITITSVGVDRPVVATLFFDTFSQAVATEQPTATPPPLPSPTVVAKLTAAPSATLTPSPTAAPIPTLASTPSGVPIWAVGLGALTFVGILLIVGLITWVAIRSRNQKL